MGRVIKKWQKPKDTFSIVCEIDEHPDDPFKIDAYITTFVLSHKRYNLGNKTSIDFSTITSWEGVKAAIKREFKDALCITPVYMYDHSGISLSNTPFSCPWDSGQVGYALIRKSHLKYWGLDVNMTQEELLKRIMDDTFKYSLYLNGESYIISLVEHTTCETCGQHVTSIIEATTVDSDIDDIPKDIFGKEYAYIFDYVIEGD